MENLTKILEKIRIIPYTVSLLLYYGYIDFFNQNLITKTKYFEIDKFYGDEALVFSIIWTSLFLILNYIMRYKIKKIITLIFNIFLLIFSIVNYFVYSYFTNIVSWKDLFLTGEGFSFISSIFKYINIDLTMFLIFSILLIIIIFQFTPKSTYKFKSFQTIIIIGLLVVIGVNYSNNSKKATKVVDGWNTTAVYTNDSNYYATWIDSNKLIKIGGTYDYLFRDLYLTFLKKDNLAGSSEFINNYINNNKGVDTGKYNGIFKNKNLIFVMMESMDDWLINENVTPTIWNMMHHGFNFTNHYSAVYVTGSTANTEFIANTGIYPVFNGLAPVYAYVDNNYIYSLPNMFKDNNYTVNSFHRSNGFIYNRNKMHVSLGYEKYYNYAEMGINDSNFDLDEYIALNGYNKIVSSDKFMSFIITYSPHSPYNYSKIECQRNLDNIKSIYPNLTDEEKICAYSSARDTDDMFKSLIEQLKNDNLLNNTIIVAFTDHPNNVVVRDDETDLLNKTAFFIYDSTMDNNQISTITSTINILPTLKNLFGFKNEYVYPGYDALNTKDGYIIFKDYTYYDGKTIIPITNDLHDEVIFSKDLLISDYYKK